MFTAECTVLYSRVYSFVQQSVQFCTVECTVLYSIVQLCTAVIKQGPSRDQVERNLVLKRKDGWTDRHKHKCRCHETNLSQNLSSSQDLKGLVIDQIRCRHQTMCVCVSSFRLCQVRGGRIRTLFAIIPERQIDQRALILIGIIISSDVN